MDKDTLAFPSGAAYPYEHGMTLRDYFAAKAMQAMIASEYSGTGPKTSGPRWVEDAYAMADAMLAAREIK
jgi:hypothetical protein